MGGSISGAQDAVSFSEQNALPQKARRGTRIAKVRKTVGGESPSRKGRKVNRLKDACCNFVHSTARKMGKNGQVPGRSERTRIEYFLRDKDTGECGHRWTI